MIMIIIRVINLNSLKGEVDTFVLANMYIMYAWGPME